MNGDIPMSKKNADSSLPADDFTMTDGYNYGLDGFQFDTDYGSGVVDGARLPEVQGLAGLPDGKGRFDYQDGDSAIQLSDRNQLQLPLDATVDRITYKTPQQVASSYLASILKRVSQMGFALA